MPIQAMPRFSSVRIACILNTDTIEDPKKKNKKSEAARKYLDEQLKQVKQTYPEAQAVWLQDEKSPDMPPKGKGNHFGCIMTQAEAQALKVLDSLHDLFPKGPPSDEASAIRQKLAWITRQNLLEEGDLSTPKSKIKKFTAQA